MMDDPLTYGERAIALLEEAVLLALEESRPWGYVSSLTLSKRIGLGPPGMPSPNGQGYGHVAVMGILYGLYLAGRIEPAHQPNRRGHWGGWRITDSEHGKRQGVDSDDASLEPLPEPEPQPDAPSQLSSVGWISLEEYPMPSVVGGMPDVPSLIRFPDHQEYPINHWEQLLTRTVEWLNDRGILTSDDIPVKMSRGNGYLVNTEPVQADGTPMSKTARAGGPDQFWVRTQSSASGANYSVFHAKRLLEMCDQALGGVDIFLPEKPPVALSEGWVSLRAYPMPPSVGPVPDVPPLIRFPDHREYRLEYWEQLLGCTVEWLNENGILTPDQMPVKMARGSGCLVNLEPTHSDGRTMSRCFRAGGPDQFWVYTKASASHAYHAVFHAKRLLDIFRQDLSDVVVLLPTSGS